MPHLKCEHCHTRVHQAWSLDPADDVCPECEAPLEPVGGPAELVGYRLMTAQPSDLIIQAAQAAHAPIPPENV